MLLTIGCRKKPTVNPEALHQAVRAGNIKQIQSLIAKGADINAKSRSDRTPLHWAALMGHKDVLELLIAKAQI